MIAVVSETHNRDENAHLIAAAPDMLEALEAFQNAFEGFEGDIQARGLVAQVCIGDAIEKAKTGAARSWRLDCAPGRGKR